jgi:hypothetical protein
MRAVSRYRRALPVLAGIIGTGCHALLVRPELCGEVRAESASFVLRSDLSAAAREAILREAEDMRAVRDGAFSCLGSRGGPARYEIVAFASPEAFRRFLAAHVSEKAQAGAIGFYCDAGGECALVSRDPPAPDDLRVLRHEIVHQHLAARLRGRIAPWLEEGLAEALAVERGAAREGSGGGAAGPLGGATGCLAGLVADEILAALAVESGRPSWSSPATRTAPATAVPPPDWAAGEEGYVMHLLFVRFLDSIGEGRAPPGALAAALSAAARGDEARLDLSCRFASVGALERAFHDFIVRETSDAPWTSPQRSRAKAVDSPAPAAR